LLTDIAPLLPGFVAALDLSQVGFKATLVLLVWRFVFGCYIPDLQLEE